MYKTIAFFWENYEFGGVTTNLASLINSKKFRKNKIIIFSNKTNKGLKKLRGLIRNGRVKIITFNNYLDLKYKSKSFKLFLMIIRPVVFFFTLVKIFYLLKKFKIDIFISQCGGYGDFRSDLGSILIAKFLNFPSKAIVFHHSYSKPRLWSFLSNLFNSIIMNFSDKFIFVSTATYKNLSKKIFFNNFKKKNFKILNNGIELDKINSNPKIKKLINKRFLNGIVLSRISEDKGHEDLIRAFSLLPGKIKNKFRIYFVGEGDKKYILYLKKLILEKKMKNYFYFAGYIKGSSRGIINHFNFLVSPSRYFEGFGLSIAEALSVGTTVISTKVGGVTDFLNNKNSILVRPFDIKQICKALIKVSKNEKDLINKKKNGKRLIETKFTNNIMGEKYFNYLNKIFYD